MDPRTATQRTGVSDMTTIAIIDEDGINNNLKIRYNDDIIYTYTGSILIAVNPYKHLNIFSKDFVQKYHKEKLGVLDPHVFALAEAAYNSIVEDGINQSCVISGESGAGKTESTKLILQYLCAITVDASTWIQQQILEANTILEAFGNAKTVRNDNSSRFGKFMQVCFDSKHFIKGCVIQDYLLEQSRITFQSQGERNYHVFYQLVAQGQNNKEMALQLHLESLEFYKYLNTSENIEINIDIEAKKFESLTMAFTIVQISETLIQGVLKVLSAILWLGNLEFVDVDGERCDVSESDKNIYIVIANLLGLGDEDFMQVLLRRQINVRGNITEIPLKIHEARESRHSMAKALYSRTFAWLVSKINSCTNPGQDSTRFLGVLDIFGFENFSKNSFEQICINYTNEKLHKFFNNYVFSLEQEIYNQEEISYSHVEFTDNVLCLELIDKPPRCIFKLLTEQCHMPKGSDVAYVINLHNEFEYNPYYIKGSDRRHWETEFGIKHYAGCVIYTVEGFVEKNRDVQQDVLFDLMSRSTDVFVQELASYKDPQIHSQISATIPRGTSKTKCTVIDTFRQQLQALIDVLQNTKQWYVRCIKPNSQKLPNSYNECLVLDQLRYLGMLDIIRIRREGFPIHLSFEEFVLKYKCLVKQKKFTYSQCDIINILNKLNVSNNEWQIGKTKIFLRTKAYEPLEDFRKEVIKCNAITLQKNWRRYVCWKSFTRLKWATLKIQHSYRGWKMRISFLRMRRSAIIIQSHLRGVFAREVATALREMRRVDEEMKKRERCANENLTSTVESSEATKALEDCERLVQEEISALVHIAEQINCRFANGNGVEDPSHESFKTQVAGENCQQSSEPVDLDNLFAFLSDVTPSAGSNLLLDEINDKMDNLVQDLDDELGVCNQNEDSGLKNSIKTYQSKGKPTLPEPTMPPPPPPIINVNNIGTNIPVNLITTTDYPKNEPIYEAVVQTETLKYVSKKTIETIMDKKSIQENRETIEMIDNNSTKKNDSVFQLNSPTHKTGSATEPSKIQEQQTDREQRRKHRVERKLQEMHHNNIEVHKDAFSNEIYYDILEFAENYFNTHERSPEGTIIATLTRKGKKNTDLVPKCEMVTFTKIDKIPTSHIHMYDPENVLLACSIFRELCKYMRGEFIAERELQAIQYIIGLGIEREELRDEIIMQCIRQTTKNPNVEWTDRLWLLMCLVIVAFQPSKMLFRYFVSYLRKTLEVLDGKLRQYAQWCYDNCKCTKVSTRVYPPSSVEVAAMRRLGTIVCRFFFLDGRTKAIDVHPTDTAGDAVQKLADKLNLTTIEGWSIFQSRPDGEDHIKTFDYLYDIISAWEIKQKTAINIKKITNSSNSGENRFVFKKRLFKSTKELSQDPVEVNMLYAQAVYCVVKCDDFPVSEKVALQLAGLQAQVALGDPSKQPKPEYYSDVSIFLPERISKTREPQFWIPILAQAHRQYGASRNELTAKVLYLSCVMQYPLYGTTMFNAIYKGYWNFTNNIILGINSDGILLIQPEDKFILYQFKYTDIESILLDPSDSFITISLSRIPQQNQVKKDENMIFENQKCFVFETVQKNEIGSLIISYYPLLSNWIMNNFESSKKTKGITNEDRARLYQNIVVCRRQLIDMEVVRKPQETGGFFRNTLRRLSKQRLEKLRAEQRNSIQDHGETYKGFPHSFWAFSKQHIVMCLSKLSDQEEAIMTQIFHSILTYSGLGTCGETIKRAEDEHITIVQSIMDKCMRKDSLLNELYLQLIKQTTDHPDPNSRVNLRHWALLCLACSVILPSVKVVRKYLIAHLKRCASDFMTEEGKYARFAEKCFFKTQGTRRRQWTPSREEILCTTNRRPCYARFYFMDGQYYSIEFHASSTAYDVIDIIKKKIGLQDNALGYALYEVLGSTERSLSLEEKVCDVMAKWEKYRNASQQVVLNQTVSGTTYCRHQHYVFLFKKHLFCDDYMNLDDPIEKELLYHQILHSLRSERFPITEMEAIMLTALQGQLELGDCGDVLHDYRNIAGHCLPPRFVPNIPHEAVAMHHQSLRGMVPTEAKKSFLNIIQSWPLHRATIFDVMQTFTSNWPRMLWLAIDQVGIHLLEHRSRNVLCTHDYESIASYSPNMNSIMIFTGSEKKQSKVILSTSQAFQISTLIKEYSEIVKTKRKATTHKC